MYSPESLGHLAAVQEVSDAPNALMQKFETDIFLSDRPHFSHEQPLEKMSSFCAEQLSLYKIYPDIIAQ